MGDEDDCARERRYSALEIPTPLGVLKIRGFGAVLVLLLVAVIGVGYQQHEFNIRVDLRLTTLEKGLVELTHATQKNNRIAAFQACILTLPPDKRENQWQSNSFCANQVELAIFR